MTLSFQITPRWLFFVYTGLLLCSLVSCAPPAPPCKNDDDCSDVAPYCISGACRECKGSDDCASQKCQSGEVCDPSEPISKESLTEASQEPALEPVSSNDADAVEIATEPVMEVGPEPQPEPVPEAVCANGTTRPCYPAGKIGCSADTGGKYACKGICAAGTESCVGGDWSGKCSVATEPTTELCNGKDDDCDGVVDNGFANLGQSCDVGQGECKATGKFVCKTDGSGVECDAKPGTPTAELCDKKDNNCDGSVDEGCPCVLGDTQSCGVNKGECKKGTQTCDINGKWGTCVGEVKSETEMCNSKDDDCNGVIDDIADLNQICTDSNRKGVCQIGVWECVNGRKVCKQTTQASSEICDGKDNDCNGLIDDNAPGCSHKCTSNTECPPAYPNCQAGQCIRFCKVHTDCDDTSWCQQGFCQNCPNSTKQSDTEICDGKDNNCNGKIDESFSEYQKACTISKQQGECAKGTYTACNQGKLVCAGPSPQTETCNGKDDDCDGQIDNRCGFFWASSAGGSGVDQGESIINDSAGNLYITGSYYGTASFGTTTLTSKGQNAIFVAKLDNQGSFQWASSAGGGTDYDIGSSIAVDSAGNLYITGSYYGTASFGTTTLTSKGGRDVFVAKLDNQGSFQWATSAGGTSVDSGQSIAVDSAGNLYITGSYYGTANFSTTALTSKGDADIYVAKLNNQGSFQWASSAGGTSYDREFGVAVDSAGNLYITGWYQGTANFGTTTLTSKGSYDIYVAKLNNQGSFQWATSAGGTEQDSGFSIATDSSGNLYITGYYNRTASFGTTTLTSKGGRDVFVAKLDNQGSFQWASSAGGISSDIGRSIAVDSAGNLYITGGYDGTVNFGTTTLTSKSGAETFVAKLNNQGVFQWASSAGESIMYGSEGYSITVDSAGDLYITGNYYNGTVNFGTTTLTSKGLGDIFVVKLRF